MPVVSSKKVWYAFKMVCTGVILYSACQNYIGLNLGVGFLTIQE